MDETSDRPTKSGNRATETGDWAELFERANAYEVTVAEIQQTLQRYRDTDE